MNGMLCKCYPFISFDLSNFKSNNILDINDMFFSLNKKFKLESNDKIFLNSFY